jgi:hypothetical protein
MKPPGFCALEDRLARQGWIGFALKSLGWHDIGPYIASRHETHARYGWTGFSVTRGNA